MQIHELEIQFDVRINPGLPNEKELHVRHRILPHELKEDSVRTFMSEYLVDKFSKNFNKLMAKKGFEVSP